MIDSITANHSQLLNKFKGQLQAIKKNTAQSIPGINIEWPNDLTINEPENILINELGVKLKGGNNLTETINQLPNKLNRIVDNMKEQKDAAINEMEQYIEDQRATWQREEKKWNQLAENCNNNLNTAYQAAAEAKAEKALAEAEKEQTRREINNFCRKYDRLSQNPAGGCGEKT